MVEAKFAVREKEETECQEESKVTFSFGLWNFSDFDAGIKTFDLRDPSVSNGSIFFDWDLDRVKQAGCYGETRE